MITMVIQMMPYFYQDILQYSIIKQKESRDEGFTLWKITNWLIKNNIEFVEYYNQIDKRTMKHF